MKLSKKSKLAIGHQLFSFFLIFRVYKAYIFSKNCNSVILKYHRISKIENRENKIDMSNSPAQTIALYNFEKHIKFLKDHFKILNFLNMQI